MSRMPDPDEIVARYWPLDQRSHDHLRTALATAAELVRYANHVTLDNADTALEYAGELYVVTGAVVGLIERLPQLLRQLSDRADAFTADPTLRHGRGGDPAEAMAAASEFLRQASGLMGAPMGQVQAARAEMTWIGHR